MGRLVEEGDLVEAAGGALAQVVRGVDGKTCVVQYLLTGKEETVACDCLRDSDGSSIDGVKLDVGRARGDAQSQSRESRESEASRKTGTRETSHVGHASLVESQSVVNLDSSSSRLPLSQTQSQTESASAETGSLEEHSTPAARLDSGSVTSTCTSQSGATHVSAESGVDSEGVRICPRDRVTARYGGGTRWYPGVVSAVWRSRAGSDVTFSYDIVYDDGDQEFDVPSDDVAILVEASTSRTYASAPGGKGPSRSMKSQSRRGSDISSQQERNGAKTSSRDVENTTEPPHRVHEQMCRALPNGMDERRSGFGWSGKTTRPWSARSSDSRLNVDDDADDASSHASAQPGFGHHGSRSSCERQSETTGSTTVNKNAREAFNEDQKGSDRSEAIEGDSDDGYTASTGEDADGYALHVGSPVMARYKGSSQQFFEGTIKRIFHFRRTHLEDGFTHRWKYDVLYADDDSDYSLEKECVRAIRPRRDCENQDSSFDIVNTAEERTIGKLPADDRVSPALKGREVAEETHEINDERLSRPFSHFKRRSLYIHSYRRTTGHSPCDTSTDGYESESNAPSGSVDRHKLPVTRRQMGLLEHAIGRKRPTHSRQKRTGTSCPRPRIHGHTVSSETRQSASPPIILSEELASTSDGTSRRQDHNTTTFENEARRLPSKPLISKSDDGTDIVTRRPHDAVPLEPHLCAAAASSISGSAPFEKRAQSSPYQKFLIGAPRRTETTNTDVTKQEVDVASLGRLGRELAAIRFRARPAITNAHRYAVGSVVTKTAGSSNASESMDILSAWVMGCIQAAAVAHGDHACTLPSLQVESVLTARTHSVRDGLRGAGYHVSDSALAVLRSSFRLRTSLPCSSVDTRGDSADPEPMLTTSSGNAGEAEALWHSRTAAGVARELPGYALIAIVPLVAFLCGSDSTSNRILLTVNRLAAMRSSRSAAQACRARDITY